MSESLTAPSDLHGRTYVVTGGNRGIGLATVTALVARGARVLLGCRDVDQGNEALTRVRESHDEAETQVSRLDLADLSSVSDFARQVTRQAPQVDGLINSAGVMMPPLGRTTDGFETQFGTNVLGHFALTGHLLPVLTASAAGRVVSVSSLGHWFARLDWDNLNAEKGYGKMRAYAQSKLANLVFAHELERRLAARRATVASIGAHPGICKSDLARHSPAVRWMMPVVAQPASKGALPSLVAATAPQVRGGDYVGPGGLLTLRGKPRVQRSSARSRDPEIGRRLWDEAQGLTGVTYLDAV